MEEKKEMTLNEYQKAALKTCLPSCDNFSYMMLNLVGEVGELASKVAKQIRKTKAEINDNYLYVESDDEEDVYNDKLNRLIMLEAGDILWQLSGLVHTFGYTLDDVAKMNLEKLASRAKRHCIEGDGDER